jgi:hypothetical protein
MVEVENSWQFSTVDIIKVFLRLDTSYLPEGKVLCEGGQIDAETFFPIVRFARDAADCLMASLALKKRAS